MADSKSKEDPPMQQPKQSLARGSRSSRAAEQFIVSIVAGGNDTP